MGRDTDILDRLLEKPCYIMAEEDALLIFDWDCLHLTVYNPSEEFGSLAERIAWSEGVFWRKGEPAGTGRGVVL